MKAYFELIRPQTSIMAGLAVIIGAILSGAQLSASLPLAFLAVFFITGGGLVLNDYYDLEIDKINAPQRPLPSGRVPRKKAFFYSVGLLAVGILLSGFLNIYCFILALLNSFLEFFYSRTFKRSFFLGNVIVSYFAASTFLFGTFLTFNFEVVGIMAALAFLANLGREILKDIEDIKGDRKMKLDTLSVTAGSKSAEKIAQGFTASAILLSPLPYSLGLLNHSYLIIVSIGDILFLYSFFQKPTKAKKTTKIAMFIVLLAFLFGKFI